MKSTGHPMSSPPREFPLLMRLNLYFGGGASQLSWLIFAIGVFMFNFYEIPLLVKSHMAFLHHVEKTKGVVVNFFDTERSVESESTEDESVFGVSFSFDDETGEKIVATSYTRNKIYDVGDIVDVEFSGSNPNCARIAGLSFTTSTSGLIIIPILSILWGLGIISVLGNFMNRRKIARLIRFGEIAKARLISKKATAFLAGEGKPFYNLEFAFKDLNGILHTVMTKTHLVEALEDDKEKLLLFDPRNPSRSMLMDMLPPPLVIDSHNNFAMNIDHKITRMIFSLILPCLSVAGLFFTMAKV